MLKLTHLSAYDTSGNKNTTSGMHLFFIPNVDTELVISDTTVGLWSLPPSDWSSTW